MCEPVSATAAATTAASAASATAATAATASAFTIPTWFTTTMQIASAVGSLYQQQQQMSAISKANQQNYDNQMWAYRQNQAANNFTRIQEAENLAQRKLANDAASRRAQSTATVAAGEAGISGLSVDALLAELGGMSGRDNTNAEVNYLRRDFALQTEAQNNYARTASAINQLETPKAPDYLGAALKITNAADNYFNPRLQRQR